MDDVFKFYANRAFFYYFTEESIYFIQYAQKPTVGSSYKINGLSDDNSALLYNDGSSFTLDPNIYGIERMSGFSNISDILDNDGDGTFNFPQNPMDIPI